MIIQKSRPDPQDFGFDSAAQRALEKSKVGEVNLEVSSRIVFNFKP